MRINFNEITVRRKKIGVCPVCNTAVVRQQTFMNTVSPFNKNEDGSMRTEEEVRKNVEKIANEWTPDFTHEKCK